MKTRRFLSAVCALFVAAFLCESASQHKLRGDWIKPGWPDGKEPHFPNRAFCWMSADGIPNKVVIYRKQVTIGRVTRITLSGARPAKPPILHPAGRVFAAMRIVSPGHVYVFVNGKEVYGSDRRKENPVVVLSPFLSTGREHVIMVAAPAEGFAMAGFVEPADERRREEIPRTPLRTDTTWRVKKFPPTTAIEFEPCWNPGFDDSGWFPVEVDCDKGVGTSADVLLPAIWRAEIERLFSDIDEAEWRLSLIARRGIAIIDSIAYHGSAPDRVTASAVSAAKEGLSRIQKTRHSVAELKEKDVHDEVSFAANTPGLLKAMSALFRLQQVVESATNLLYLSDQVKNLRNCSLVLKQVGRAFASDFRKLLDKLRAAEAYQRDGNYDFAYGLCLACMNLVKPLRAKIEEGWGHPLNRYNESRFSMMGWIPNSQLVDGELGDWGLHVGAVEAPQVVSLSRKWRFKLDPNNEGLAQGWHTIGFNIEGQWPTISVPGSWENKYRDANPNAAAQNPYKGKAEVSNDRPYNGFAWYRARVRVPEEWRGNDLELRLSWANDWDWTYFNEQLVGRTGPETPSWTEAPRRYSLPKDIVKFGEENVIAVRVFDAGGEGGLGRVELRCPGLLAAGTSQAVSMIRSFLSPGILLQASGKELTIWGKKESEGFLFLPLRRGNAIKKLKPGQAAYRAHQDRELAENWLLWSPGFAGSAADRPIEIVLEKNPVEIRVSSERDRSSLTLVFAEPGAHLVLIRPMRIILSEGTPRVSENRLVTCRFWARALLEYPVAYTEMTRLDPRDGNFIQVFDIYNYRRLQNEWGIEPLRVAPAPVFLTYALRTGWPGLTVLSKLTDTNFDLGKYGAYQAVPDSNIISYRYSRDKMLRLGGFTSWVFMPWDAGVPGNDRECEVIAQTGANSYRPQHNFAGEKARIFADYCNKYGINYMNNPDNGLGGKGGKHGENVEAWVSHYRELAGMFKDRPEYAVAFDLINEAANMKPEIYNSLIKRLTNEIREIDPLHLLYVETCNSWGAVEQFPTLAVTSDLRTVYSFHDYNFRLRGNDRWPSLKWDIRQMYKRWMPAFDFQLKNHVRLHLGEFGGYEKGGELNPCAITMLHDVFRILDQFNWHFNYYPGRGIMWPRADGSLRPNTVAWAFKRYFELGYFNMYFAPEERNIIK